MNLAKLPPITDADRRLITDPKHLNLLFRTFWGITRRLEDGDIIEFGRVVTKHKSYVVQWYNIDLGIYEFLVRCKINGFDTFLSLNMFKKSKILKGKICSILSHFREHSGYLYVAQHLHRKTFKVKGFSTCVAPKFDRITGERIFGETVTIKIPYLIHYK